MVLAIVLTAGKYDYAMGESIPIEIWTSNLDWDFWVEKQGGQEVFSKSGTGMSSFSFAIDSPGDYLLQSVTRGEPNYDSIVIHVIGPTSTPPALTVSGKEYVFEFSGQINQNSLVVSAASKIVALLGGKSVYIEGNKLVVVM